MEALPMYILIFLFMRTVKAQANLNGCIKKNAEAIITCTLPVGISVDQDFVFWYVGTDENNIVSGGDADINDPKYDSNIDGNKFSLIIHNLQMNDFTRYKCFYAASNTEFFYNIAEDDVEVISCNVTGETNEVKIEIEYNNKESEKPKAVLEKSGEVYTPVDCIDGPSDRTCTFKSLAAGMYSYTVNNNGECLLTCTGQFIVLGVPTTTAAPTTAAPTTVAPTTVAPTTTAPTTAAPTTIAPTIAAPTTVAPTTTAPTTAAPTTTAPTTTAPTTIAPTIAAPTTATSTTAAPVTTDAATSKPTDNFQIIYAVVGSLCGIIIIFAVVAILIYKNRKHKRSVEKKQSRPKQRNQLNGRSSHQYDNRAFSGSAHGHMYNTGRPYPSHVSSHSYSMSPVYQQQDRNDRNHLQGHKPGLYFSGGSNRERPLNVKYYTGQSQRY